MKTAAELISIVQNTNPTAKITTLMTFEPYLIHVVIFTDKDEPQAIAYVNQYTGDIQGVYQDITLNGFMRSLHGWLLLPWGVITVLVITLYALWLLLCLAL